MAIVLASPGQQATKVPNADGPWQRAGRAFARNRGAIYGLILLAIILIAVFGAQWIAPYDPVSQSLRDKTQPPSAEHLFGTDAYGRDVFSRVLWGGQSSLWIAFASVFASAIIGMIIGGYSGFTGGTADAIITRISDALFTFPVFLLALIVVAILGPSESNVIIAIAISTIPRFVRMVRAEVMVVTHEEYVTAARTLGLRPLSILFKHVLPNAVPTMVVLIPVFMAGAIMAETGLSFLGLGTQPPEPSWGLMISSSRGLLLTAPWTVAFPSLAIILLVLALNMVGDGVRDALDPRFN